MKTLQDKKNEKVIAAAEKYSLNFIKNATLNTIKRNDSKALNDTLIEDSRKKSSYCSW